MALRIKEIIDKKGLTIVAVAEKMGITVGGLRQHMNGNPSVAVLSRIAEVLEVPVSSLFDDYEDYVTINDQIEVSCPHCGKPIKIAVEKVK